MTSNKKKMSVWDIRGDLTPMHVAMILANARSARALMKELGYRKYLPWNYPKVRYLRRIIMDEDKVRKWLDEKGYSVD